MRYFTFLLNNMWTSLIQVLLDARPPLAHPKEHLHWFLATTLQCNKQSTLSFKSDCFTSPELTMYGPFAALCVTANDLKKKSKRLWPLLLSLVYFLKWPSKQSINEWLTTVTRGCTIYHNTLILVARKKHHFLWNWSSKDKVNLSLTSCQMIWMTSSFLP